MGQIDPSDPNPISLKPGWTQFDTSANDMDQQKGTCEVMYGNLGDALTKEK